MEEIEEGRKKKLLSNNKLIYKLPVIEKENLASQGGEGGDE